MHVTRQPVELGDDDRAFQLARRVQRGGELRASIQRIRPLARLNYT
jgi:hypothetical protein